MKDGRIEDSQISSSGVYQDSQDRYDYAENMARLDGRGCWSADANNKEEWIQVEFNRTMFVSGIVLQGSPYYSEWVKEYKTLYTIDGSITWQYVVDGQSKIKVSVMSDIVKPMLHENLYNKGRLFCNVSGNLAKVLGTKGHRFKSSSSFYASQPSTIPTI